MDTKFEYKREKYNVSNEKMRAKHKEYAMIFFVSLTAFSFTGTLLMLEHTKFWLLLSLLSFAWMFWSSIHAYSIKFHTTRFRAYFLSPKSWIPSLENDLSGGGKTKTLLLEDKTKNRKIYDFSNLNSR